MKVFRMTENNIPDIARFMAYIKPDWWDYEGGAAQLGDIRNTVDNVGWFMGEDEKHPKGWLLCHFVSIGAALYREAVFYPK